MEFYKFFFITYLNLEAQKIKNHSFLLQIFLLQFLTDRNLKQFFYTLFTIIYTLFYIIYL